eukprot:6184056-Pleurochrysis_carterae.AAC.2
MLAEHLDGARLLVEDRSVQLEAVLDDRLADDVALEQLLDGVEGVELSGQLLDLELAAGGGGLLLGLVDLHLSAHGGHHHAVEHAPLRRRRDDVARDLIDGSAHDLRVGIGEHDEQLWPPARDGVLEGGEKRRVLAAGDAARDALDDQIARRH